MLAIIALGECFVCTNLTYSQWAISSYYLFPYRMSKSPNKSFDYLEVYIGTHLKTVIFLWCRVYSCYSMTGLDIFNLHHSMSKPSKSVCKGRGCSFESPSCSLSLSLSLSLNSLPEVGKLLWDTCPFASSSQVSRHLHLPQKHEPRAESPGGSVYDSQLCTSGILFKPIAEA